MNKFLGFSTGAIYKTGLGIEKSLEFISSLGIKVLELGYGRPERFQTDPLEGISLSLLKRFDWVSFHAPGSLYKYEDNEETRKLLEKIEGLHQRFPLNLVVFHPDSVMDFSILEDYSFPVAVENMDSRKESFKTVESIGQVLKDHPK